MAHYLFAGCEWALCQPLQGSCRGHMVSQIAVLDIKDCVTIGAKKKRGRGHNGRDDTHRLFCLTLNGVAEKCVIKKIECFF